MKKRTKKISVFQPDTECSSLCNGLKFHLPFNFQYQNVREWDEHMSKNGIKNPDGSKNQKLTELACHYIKGYAFQIDTLNNPRIKDFNEIIELANKRQWNLVFNLLAENTEKAKQLVGNELIYMINENAQILECYFKHRGVLVVNNLNTVENEQFIDQNWTTEHYAEKGRKTIAKNVAEALKIRYKDDYKSVDGNRNYQTEFYNDCENTEIVWGQMQTITKETAFSGQSSSETGNGNDFSITFEYPLKAIPDSLKETINIALMLKPTAHNHDAKLVLEAHGSNFSYYQNNHDLKDVLNTAKNKWIKLEKTIIIPDSIKQADLIKIYVYNPNKDKIYTDDFRIKIE